MDSCLFHYLGQTSLVHLLLHVIHREAEEADRQFREPVVAPPGESEPRDQKGSRMEQMRAQAKMLSPLVCFSCSICLLASFMTVNIF